jgi:hypothetical protein
MPSLRWLVAVGGPVLQQREQHRADVSAPAATRTSAPAAPARWVATFAVDHLVDLGAQLVAHGVLHPVQLVAVPARLGTDLVAVGTPAAVLSAGVAGRVVV